MYFHTVLIRLQDRSRQQWAEPGRTHASGQRRRGTSNTTPAGPAGVTGNRITISVASIAADCIIGKEGQKNEELRGGNLQPVIAGQEGSPFAREL